MNNSPTIEFDCVADPHYVRREEFDSLGTRVAVLERKHEVHVKDSEEKNKTLAREFSEFRASILQKIELISTAIRDLTDGRFEDHHALMGAVRHVEELVKARNNELKQTDEQHSVQLKHQRETMQWIVKALSWRTVFLVLALKGLDILFQFAQAHVH